MIRNTIVIILFIVALSACQAKQEGAIEGTVNPAGTAAQITALRDGKEPLMIPVNAQDGKFKSRLPAGTYTIMVKTPTSPYPITLQNILVKTGETTIVPPFDLKPTVVGTARLSGKILPVRPGAEVKLMQEGQERAAVHADSEGNFEFKELPAGTYDLRASSPGHADDSTQVNINENQAMRQNAVLLPISSINGVDWSTGKIRATGIGMPPATSPNETVRREMAKRAALLDAERNMLRTIEQIRIDGEQTVKTVMGDKKAAYRIQGFLKGFSVISERELEDGKREVIIELPLTGPSGLSRYISE